MSHLDIWWSWLIRDAVLGGLVLTAGWLAVLAVRQPADRLRLIQWVLICCLVVPWLPVSANWQTVAVNLTGRNSTSAALDAPLPQAPLSTEVVSRAVSPTSLDAQSLDGATVTARHEPQLPDLSNTSLPRLESQSDPAQAPAAMPASPSLTRLNFARVTFGLWTLAVTALALRSLLGLWLRMLLRQGASIASPELALLFEDVSGMENRNVRLLVSDAIDSPVTWGIWRPVILVPRQFEILLQEPETRWGLAHEWSHVQRRDMATLWLAMAAQFLCFYQPLYWVLRRKLILCQDNLADAFAVRQAQSAADYAAFLVRLAAARMRSPAIPALGIFEGRSQMFQRIKMLIERGTDIRPSCRRRIAVLSVCGSLAGLLLLTTIQLDAAADSPAVVAQADGVPGAPESLNATAPDQVVGPAEPGVVKGVLVDAATGKPVAEANVLLVSGNSKTSKSDAEGRFRFENMPDFQTGYRVMAYRGNLVAEFIRVEQQSQTAGPPLFVPAKLLLKSGRKAKFVLKSQASGQPLPNAVIKLGYPDRRRVETGEDGSATVEGLLPKKYSVIVEAPGYARYAPEIDLAGDAGDFAASLAPGGEVAGIVVNDVGQPVANAEVAYWQPGLSGYHGEPPRTDERGNFRYRSLPLDVPLEITVSTAEQVTERQDVSLTTQSPSRIVRITLPRRPIGPTARGVVLDQNGKPVADAELLNSGRNVRRTGTTDTEGRFEIQDLLEGFSGFELRVSAKGFAPQVVKLTPPIPEGAPDMKVSLEPGHTFRGRVVNEAGQPVAAASIMLRHPAYQYGSRAVRSDNEGMISLDSLPSEVRFALSHPDYAIVDNLTFPLDGADVVTITLEDPGQLRGQVLDAETRKPVPQYIVRLGGSHLREAGDAQGSYNAALANPGVTVRNAEGRFQIQPLMARMAFELIIEAEGYERLLVPRAVAAKGKDSPDLALSLKRQVPGKLSSLTVQLRNDEGQPLFNASLRLVVSTTPPTGKDDNKFNWALVESNQLGQKSYVEQFLPGVTDPAGEFTFQNISPGKFLQVLYWGDGVPKGRWLAGDPLTAGESGRAAIEIPRPARVKGTIDREKFPNAGEVSAHVSSESFLRFKATFTGDGSTFEIPDLPPGEVQVYVMSKQERVIENGQEMFRSSVMASKKLNLKPGSVEEIHFDTPAPPR